MGTKNSSPSLGERMKLYEASFKQKLPPRMPVLIRLDGKSFHTLTRRLKKPFDYGIIEISLLLVNYQDYNTQPWFDNTIQKISSVSAGIASAEFCFRFSFLWWLMASPRALGDAESFPTPIPPRDKAILYSIVNENRTGKWPAVTTPTFDSRVFALPHHEVANCFLWRQQDWERNSVQMLARAYFSQKECHKLNNKELQNKLFTEKGVNWNDLPSYLRRGSFAIKEYYEVEGSTRSRWKFISEVPRVAEDREFINTLVYVGGDFDD